MDQLLNEIRFRLENETRSSPELVSSLKQMGLLMFVTGTITKEQVVTFCTALLKLYQNTREKYNAQIPTSSN